MGSLEAAQNSDCSLFGTKEHGPLVLGLPEDHRVVNDLLSPNITMKHGVLSSGRPVLKRRDFVILSCSLAPDGTSVPFG